MVAGSLAITTQSCVGLLPILGPDGLEKSLLLGHARFPSASGPEALCGVEIHGERSQEGSQSLNLSEFEIAGQSEQRDAVSWEWKRIVHETDARGR
jgi:hypothetical protein